MKRAIAVFLTIGAEVLIFTIAPHASAQTFNIQLNVGLLNSLPQPTTTDPPGNFRHVQPADFDPGKTYLVQATWLSGIGCPTSAKIAVPNTSFTGIDHFDTYTDPACMTGDASDHHNEGLLLVKTGPSINNFAAATAELTNVKGITTLTELGYDIRKKGDETFAGPHGSHCGAGAPRFDIVTTTDFFFLGCSSPAPTMESSNGDGWIRLRWSPVTAFSASTFTLGPVTGTVERIVIVFDEGTDATGGPDQFGAAILDNIDVNGTLVGQGAVTAN